MSVVLNPKFFPTFMIAGSILAAAVYAYSGDWRRVVYWIASACLITSMTY